MEGIQKTTKNAEISWVNLQPIPPIASIIYMRCVFGTYVVNTDIVFVHVSVADI